jgi:hypothetical protein
MVLYGGPFDGAAFDVFWSIMPPEFAIAIPSDLQQAPPQQMYRLDPDLDAQGRAVYRYHGNPPENPKH